MDGDCRAKSVMDYTYPDYYKKFQCSAAACTDTCCAGWGIAIDAHALKKYKAYEGVFGNRLANEIDWEDASFYQYEGRCAFLNEENLCDIYAEGGEKLLCKTCHRYPRHYEEFENIREISLSLSCPEAAKLILGTDKPMTFVTVSKERQEESYEDFDFFLFTKLQETRLWLLELLQNRSLSLAKRMAIALACVHDIQTRIDGNRLFEVDDLLEKYKKPSFLEKAQKKLLSYTGRFEVRYRLMQGMVHRLHVLEVLQPDWPEFLSACERTIYQEIDADTYMEKRKAFSAYYEAQQYEYEQLLVYFIFSYFCGAVYDGDAYAKIRVCIAHVLCLKELAFAIWMQQGEVFTFADQIELTHRFAREVEHSDLNLRTVEHMTEKDSLFSLEPLLHCILGTL